MGRATISSGGPDGEYAVTLIKNLTRATANISKLAASISDLSSKISDLTTDLNTAEGELIAARAALSAVINTGTTTEKMEATKTVLEKQSVVNQINQSIARLRLQKTQMEKQKSILEDAISADTRNVWCADLTENLSGEVGTIEVNGLGTQIIIMPGGDTGEAIGKLQPPIANTPAGAAYNFALLPWWQKFKPTYRIGVIICIPSSVEGAEADTCDVAILPVWGMQGINVNQAGDGEYWVEMDAPQGTVDFCVRHPSHPICVTTADTRIDLTSENWAAMVSVNAEVNQKMEYEYDQAQYEKLEHWEIPDDSGTTYKGDCEDMALLKMQKLITAGFPAGCLKIVVGSNAYGIGHAFLMVLTNSGDYALDINFSSPVLVGSLPYYDMYWQQNGVWGQNCVRLNNVPIEYMTCNAYAFSPGDRVIVAFTGQSWVSRKVIGFEANPKPCRALYGFGGEDEDRINVSGGYIRYVLSSDTWSTIGTMPRLYNSSNISITVHGRCAYCYKLGGSRNEYESPNQAKYDSVADSWELREYPLWGEAYVDEIITATLQCCALGNASFYFSTYPTYVGDPFGNWVISYYPLTDAYYLANFMPVYDVNHRNKQFGSVAVSGLKAYLCHGRTGHRYKYSEIYDPRNLLYDPATDTWTILTPGPSPYRELSIAAVFPSDVDKIHYVSGYEQSAYPEPAYGQPSARHSIYSISTDAWSAGTAVPASGQQTYTGDVFGNDAVCVGPGKNTLYDAITDNWISRNSPPASHYCTQRAIGL